MQKYRCKHTVEAMQWRDTDENREAFCAWFDTHEQSFETRGHVIVLPEGGEVVEGEWVRWMDNEFVPMEDALFPMCRHCWPRWPRAGSPQSGSTTWKPQRGRR